VVQIFNGDESHIINTVLAVPTERVNPTGHTQFTFWETPAGTAKALRAWYYPGDNVGNEFPYPTQPRQLVALLTPPAPMASSSSDESTTTTTTTTPAEPPVVVMDDTTSVQSDQTAQDETSPPPAADQTPAPTPPADTSADQPAPTELPKTGSPYPLIGLCGIGLAGLAGALALKRSA
jgi:LPXTG-motif cell wall-anchored protein